MSKRPTFEEFQKEAMKDPEFRAEYEALNAEFELIRQFIKARQKAHISQTDLAKKLKVQQPAIARLEGGGYAKTSIAKLSQVAKVLGYSLKISLQAKKTR
ncbi:MAG TPA: helix-turn-helix domain-containing protein [Candidatus Babeliales bacterium]|jgi:predicted transcriptional regulator|nr:helix-turn-helix domain-containing protein [Candidatus Babeliales bacterium]